MVRSTERESFMTSWGMSSTSLGVLILGAALGHYVSDREWQGPIDDSDDADIITGQLYLRLGSCTTL